MSTPTKFDVERLKHNWNRTAPPSDLAPSNRLSDVRAPGDTQKEAVALVSEIERDLLRELPDELKTLEPFLVSLRRRVAALGPKKGAAATPSGGGAGPKGGDVDARAEILKNVQALSDVCEAMMQVSR